ncbi:peptidyl-prolyl cis-trans isomerase [Oculatella sp. LEGE 06141]|nr:peptidyl-prolyl cis-trans isomerase [Oculatella sp. LEGE 06141]
MTINGQAISLAQALQYLQRSGQLDTIVSEIASQHLLSQELQSRTDLEIGVTELEESVRDFRNRNQLQEASAFEQWLTNSGLSYTAFINQISEALKLKKLRVAVSEQNVTSYFAEKHTALDEFKLTYVVTTEKEKAEEFRSRMDAGQANFDDIARECVNEALFNHSDTVSFKKESVRRAQIRPELQAVLEGAVANSIVGPVEIDQGWWVIKVEEVIEAQLEGGLKQQLETEFFKQWLNQKIQQAPIAFAMT